MAETVLHTPLGKRELHRLHASPTSPLRAWSAADELVLAEFGAASPGRLLIVNDAWGALTVSLARWSPTLWGDSALARAAIESNLALNGCDGLGPRAVRGDEIPSGPFDAVALLVPKSGALLRYQCAVVANLVNPQTRLIVAGMAKHLSRSVIETLEAELGDVGWNPAARKARLLDIDVSARRAGERAVGKEAEGFRTSSGVVVFEAPGVFSAGHLDVGSALLLDELDRLALPAPQRIADLGCGNGVLATTLARRFPSALVDMFDSSDLAVAASRATWIANSLESDRVRFWAADGYGACTDRYDLIVTNPPFHQEHAVDRELTDRLLRDTADRLADDGVAMVVAQRHLELHRRLRSWFGSVETVSRHPSHVVFACCR